MADRGRHGKKIDNVHWTLGGFTFVSQAAGVAAQTVFAAQHLPETLLRTRGEWSACLNSGQAAGVGVTVFVGMIQVPEGTGTTVLWSPFTDGDAPWVWWDVLSLMYNEMVVDVIATQNTLSGRRIIDSKAMRKLRNTELQVVVENVTLSGLSTGSVQAVGDFRSLFGA